MARVSTYNDDGSVSGGDKLLGTDAVTGINKNYTVTSIADYLNNAGAVNVLGQLAYKFNTSEQDSVANTFHLPGFGGDATPMADVTQLIFSGYPLGGYNAGTYLASLVGKTILLSSFDNLAKWAKYRLNSVTETEEGSDFYQVSLTYVEGTGLLHADEVYGMAADGIQADDGPKESVTLISEDGSVFDVVVSNAGVLVVIPEGSTDPVITSPPVIIGTEKVWYTLGAIAGGVTGSPAPERAWQWQRSTNGLTWTDIPGADAATYTLVDADAGNYIRVQQTETNVLDSATANSAATGLIADSVFSTTIYANITPITWENITQTWN